MTGMHTGLWRCVWHAFCLGRGEPHTRFSSCLACLNHSWRLWSLCKYIRWWNQLETGVLGYYLVTTSYHLLPLPFSSHLIWFTVIATICRMILGSMLTIYDVYPASARNMTFVSHTFMMPHDIISMCLVLVTQYSIPLTLWWKMPQNLIITYHIVRCWPTSLNTSDLSVDNQLKEMHSIVQGA